jgi:hypothetical protein
MDLPTYSKFTLIWAALFASSIPKGKILTTDSSVANC